MRDYTKEETDTELAARIIAELEALPSPTRERVKERLKAKIAGNDDAD